MLKRIFLSQLHTSSSFIEHYFYNMMLTKKNIPLFEGRYNSAWAEIAEIKKVMDADIERIKKGEKHHIDLGN